MTMLFIQNIWCVGMHYWGPRQLAIGAGYQLFRESNNPKCRKCRWLEKLKECIRNSHQGFKEQLRQFVQIRCRQEQQRITVVLNIFGIVHVHENGWKFGVQLSPDENSSATLSILKPKSADPSNSDDDFVRQSSMASMVMPVIRYPKRTRAVDMEVREKRRGRVI
ncbi:Hypothetical predicted protein [Mytilus galloprovincialis]|uniref:Uncharacterized protein n=1 Tax=Mytilus galloprovincialis TaxID=29158 RepID=A0A8B6BR20_MYTGA|nr:Hypothetical predicted protein [Mytilus galloprovincialis]